MQKPGRIACSGLSRIDLTTGSLQFQLQRIEQAKCSHIWENWLWETKRKTTVLRAPLKTDAPTYQRVTRYRYAIVLAQLALYCAVLIPGLNEQVLILSGWKIGWEGQESGALTRKAPWFARFGAGAKLDLGGAQH